MSSLSFSEIFEQLSQGHASNFDPVRFAFIQSLSERLASPQHQDNQALIEKALTGAQQYQVDLNSYRQQANNTLKGLSENFPEHFDVAQTLFEECQFKQLEALSVSLNRQRLNEQNLSELRGLISDINKPSEAVSNTPKQLSIDDILFQQEQNALVAAGDIPPDNTDGSGEQLVMQSMKQFRESMKHFNIDKIIARAIDEGPENPGPLNPQMLAIKSLTHMRDLSPPYLRRFANYIETLLWLEKNAAKLNNANKL